MLIANVDLRITTSSIWIRAASKWGVIWLRNLSYMSGIRQSFDYSGSINKTFLNSKRVSSYRVNPPE